MPTPPRCPALNTAPSFAQLATTLSGDWRMPVREHLQPHLTRVRPPSSLNWKLECPLQSAWGRAVEKVLSKQMALNERTATKRRPDSPSTVEKLRSGRSGGEDRPSPTKAIDLVSELNRIWERPAADKPLEPPATPKVE